MNTALFAGSFDPFTIGHKSIVDRAIGLFDLIIIGVGINPAKQSWMPLEERLQRIRQIYADQPKVKVESFSGLATDFARANGIKYMLRGVRTVADFEFERNMADANRLITQPTPLETIFIPALPELAVVSSSLVRELAHFGAPYSQFLP
jgi:pantetheine-phosphate adenylyltransferase